MVRDLKDKAIIITGASSGIGEATAIECARAGMDMVLNARRGERLAGVARAVEALGRRACIIAGDVAEPEATARMIEAARGAFGGFYAVFANAGYGLTRPVVQMSPADLRHIFEVNFFASVELVQAAARSLLEQERDGHLLMCSSCLAKFTLPTFSAYSATKAAQNHVCRAMRMELRSHGIHVSSVHPVTTATEFFQVATERSGAEAAGPRPAEARGMFVQSPQRVARAVVKCLRRPRPEVWTSTTVRAVAAFMTLSPRMADLMLRGSGGSGGSGAAAASAPAGGPPRAARAGSASASPPQLSG